MRRCRTALSVRVLRFPARLMFNGVLRGFWECLVGKFGGYMGQDSDASILPTG
jgi:hypothetical protein